ncbi:MAG: hypothetical protein JWR69_2470 [Pedosphaera sp.]|nr:hypothetical protein [Pedosphaera sp.]
MKTPTNGEWISAALFLTASLLVSCFCGGLISNACLHFFRFGWRVVEAILK